MSVSVKFDCVRCGGTGTTQDANGSRWSCHYCHGSGQAPMCVVCSVNPATLAGRHCRSCAAQIVQERLERESGR